MNHIKLYEPRDAWHAQRLVFFSSSSSLHVCCGISFFFSLSVSYVISSVIRETLYINLHKYVIYTVHNIDNRSNHCLNPFTIYIFNMASAQFIYKKTIQDFYNSPVSFRSFFSSVVKNFETFGDLKGQTMLRN